MRGASCSMCEGPRSASVTRCRKPTSTRSTKCVRLTGSARAVGAGFPFDERDGQGIDWSKASNGSASLARSS